MIKKYESFLFLTDIFKGPLSMDDDFKDFMRHENNYTELMIEIEKGNLKKIKEYIDSDYELDDINNNKDNALNVAILAEISFIKKRKIIKLLIDAGINYLYKREDGKYFYDISSKKLKKWIEIEYPKIIEEIDMKEKIDNYNL